MIYEAKGLQDNHRIQRVFAAHWELSEWKKIPQLNTAIRKLIVMLAICQIYWNSSHLETMSWTYFIFLALTEAEAMKSNFNSLMPAATMRTEALSQILYLLPCKNVPVALAMEVAVRSSDIKQLSPACQGPVFLCVE